MEAISEFIMTIIYFLTALTVLVFVHEWGHFIVARIFGVKVETFSIGFGRELFGWQDKKETRWKISIVPLGGYVKFFGDASAISNPGKYLKRIAPEDRDRCFHFKPLWQRFLIVAAGPVINIIFAIFLFIGLLYVNGQSFFDPVVGNFELPSPAQEAGLLVGDVVLEVEGNSIETFNDLRQYTIPNAGNPLEFLIEREGQVMLFTVVPRAGETTDFLGNEVPAGLIGIYPDQAHFTRTDYSFGGAVVAGTKLTFNAFGGMVDFLGRLVTGNFSKEEVGGPVKIAKITAQAASQGIDTYIFILALISVNLGLVNLLPIPLLDGGHLLFYIIEAIKGKPISVRAQELASMFGLAVVLGLLFILTWNDLNLPGLG